MYSQNVSLSLQLVSKKIRSLDTIAEMCTSEDDVNAALDKAGIPRVLSASEKRIAEMKALRHK